MSRESVEVADRALAKEMRRLSRAVVALTVAVYAEAIAIALVAALR